MCCCDFSKYVSKVFLSGVLVTEWQDFILANRHTSPLFTLVYIVHLFQHQLKKGCLYTSELCTPPYIAHFSSTLRVYNVHRSHCIYLCSLIIASYKGVIN